MNDWPSEIDVYHSNFLCILLDAIGHTTMDVFSKWALETFYKCETTTYRKKNDQQATNNQTVNEVPLKYADVQLIK